MFCMEKKALPEPVLLGAEKVPEKIVRTPQAAGKAAAAAQGI